jgi:putative spermidine/putrescine transport system permease protein
MIEKRKTNWLFKIITVITFIFILAPMVVIIIVSFNGGDVITFPLTSFSFRWYSSIFVKDSPFIAGLVNSLKIAFFATLFDIVIGILAAIGVSKYKFKGRSFLVSFFTSPMFIPAISYAFVLLQLTAYMRFMTPFSKILVGHIIIILPYIIRNLLGVLTGFNWELEEAAASLGASPFKVITKVTIPIIKPAIFSGGILAFLFSFDEAVISSFLTSAKFITLPVEIINYMEFRFDPTVAAISTLLIVLSLIIMILMDKFVGLDMLAKQ